MAARDESERMPQTRLPELRLCLSAERDVLAIDTFLVYVNTRWPKTGSHSLIAHIFKTSLTYKIFGT